MTNSEIIDYIKKSFELKNQGFYKPAIEMLYKALAVDSENLEILSQLAHLYKLLNNTDRAMDYIQKVLEINDKHLDSLILMKEIYLTQNNLRCAEEISTRIYKIQPTDENLAQKISILNKLGDFESIKAIETSTKKLSEEVLYEISHAYYDNGDNEKALELIKSAHEKNKDNQKITLFLGKIYYEGNEFEKSEEIFVELAKKNQTSEVVNYLGLFKLNKNDFSSAVNYFSKALKLDEKNHEYMYNLASAYFLNGWLDEALKYFNQAICFDSENIDYHYSLAYLYYQKKLYDKALFELDFINSIEQHHPLTNALRAMINAKKGDLFLAKSQLEDIIKYNETDDFAYYALSQIYKELSQIGSAKEMIKKAISLNPMSLQYLTELLEIETEQKNFDEALKLADKILKINDKYIFANIALAKIDTELKNFDRVYDYAQDIIELDSNCPEGYYYNAIALFEQGDKDFAIESLKKSISLDLNNAVLYIKMSEFYQDLGDLKKAYEWAKEACEIDERNYKYKWFCAKLSAALKNGDAAIKYYSQSYKLASFDKSLCEDYANYLKSVDKDKQADKILNV